MHGGCVYSGMEKQQKRLAKTLTDNEVREIRTKAAQGFSESELAEEYRIQDTAVEFIVKRRIFKLVE